MVSRQTPAARMRDGKTPRAVHTGRGILLRSSVSADVHETQAAPGLNVLVAIAADVEGRAAVKAMVVMPVTVVPTVAAMTMVSAVAMTAMPVTMATLATRRSRGHGGSTESDSGDDGE